MSRREFTKQTKRDALRRSGLLCEAIGAMYGLPAGHRCNAPLSVGVQYDHVVLDANSKDNSLENCAAVCVKCHRWKTSNHDTPMAAKTVRMQDKARGIRTAPVTKMKGPGFPKSPKASRRQAKAPLPPRQLFKPIEETRS
ncbi:HNH endonuclease [Rhizobium lentis]|uniref:HNH endonuclease signature motif containing protein n=1 Tax=Rhizobium lentis TaxID=1138194 RepID=UPI001C83B19F|nr:HNH endonuclease signature motif containing protein [Rhizobium lentis]MBX5154595.1 HNH endonuclease [Rhizobium lentis]